MRYFLIIITFLLFSCAKKEEIHFDKLSLFNQGVWFDPSYKIVFYKDKQIVKTTENDSMIYYDQYSDSTIMILNEITQMIVEKNNIDYSIKMDSVSVIRVSDAKKIFFTSVVNDSDYFFVYGHFADSVTTNKIKYLYTYLKKYGYKF